MPEIYVVCLASHVAGVNHGCLIDLDYTTVGEVEEQINEMLRASPHPNTQVDCPDCEVSAEENALRSCDTCDNTGTVPSATEYAVLEYIDVDGNWGEHPSLDKLVAYVDAVDAHGDAFVLYLNEVVGDGYYDDMDVAVTAFKESYRGTYDSEADYAAESWAGVVDIPDHLTDYIDWKAVAGDMCGTTFVRRNGTTYVYEDIG